jgi:hypothetical protein
METVLGDHVDASAWHSPAGLGTIMRLFPHCIRHPKPSFKASIAKSHFHHNESAPNVYEAVGKEPHDRT